MKLFLTVAFDFDIEILMTKNTWNENIVNKCEIQPVSEIQPMLTSLKPFVNPMLITTVTSVTTHFRSSYRKCSVKNMF